MVPTRRPPAVAPSPALTLCREAVCLVGRHVEVAEVQAGLRAKCAVVLWGGSGEGKTAIAREAACQMQEAGVLTLSVALNMRGALPAAAAGQVLAKHIVIIALVIVSQCCHAGRCHLSANRSRPRGAGGAGELPTICFRCAHAAARKVRGALTPSPQPPAGIRLQLSHNSAAM